MKLLYLTDRLSHRGGAPHHLLDLIDTMASEHSITVAAADKDSDVVLPPRVRFVRCSGLRHAHARAGGIDKLADLLSWADVVHVQNVMNPTALQLALGPNAIVTIQDHRVFCPGPGKTLPTDVACSKPMSEALCSTCLPDADRRARMLGLTQARCSAIAGAARVVVLSDYMADALTQVGITHTNVIPPPVSVGPPKTSPGRDFLLAGRLVHHKGTDLALQAFSRAAPDVALRVAGLGSVPLDGAAALGWLDRDALRTELSNARALLFPARWQEPFGIVGVEALAMGTPVIAMARGGMSAWTNVGTLVVDGVDAMARAITRLAQDPDLAQRLGSEGQDMVAKHFSPEIHHAEMTALYKTL